MTIRVLHVMNELRPSGAEQMLVTAAPHWQRLAIQGDVLSRGTYPGDFQTRLIEAGYRCHHVPMSPTHAYGRLLARLLMRERFDIVHIHAEARNVLTAVTARASGAQVLRTVHSVFSFEGALRSRKALQRSLLSRRLHVTSVGPSSAVAANEAERFGNPCRIINNWYDDSRFAPFTSEQQVAARQGLGLPLDSRVLVSVGNCAPVKGHSRILVALSALQEDVFYMHVGAGPDLAEERSLAATIGVAGRCRFAPPGQDVLTALQAADVFVMPSAYEGLSVAALEALGTGLPCVFTEVPGFMDLAVPSANITWMAPKADLAHLLEECLVALPLSNVRRGQSTEEVRSRFGSERGAVEYVRVYERLLTLNG